MKLSFAKNPALKLSFPIISHVSRQYQQPIPPSFGSRSAETAATSAKSSSYRFTSFPLSCRIAPFLSQNHHRLRGLTPISTPISPSSPARRTTQQRRRSRSPTAQRRTPPQELFRKGFSFVQDLQGGFFEPVIVCTVKELLQVELCGECVQFDVAPSRLSEDAKLLGGDNAVLQLKKTPAGGAITALP